MKAKQVLIGTIATLAVIAGWAAFRPELLFVNKKIYEAFPGGSVQSTSAALTQGNFHGVAHETKGTAAIYRLVDGKQVLRLTNFATSNGPDVRVYLVAADDAKDNATVKSAGFIELGKLKGNEGDQNYDVPASVDWNKYHAVTIWCARFGVNFATAPLTKNAG